MPSMWHLASSQGGLCHESGDAGVYYLDNPITLKSRLLHGVAFEDNPNGWHEFKFLTVKSVNKFNSTLTKTNVLSMSANTYDVFVGNSATYAIIFGI